MRSAFRRLAAVGAIAVLGGGAMAHTGPHTVQAGETLSGIAARNGTTVAALAQTNGIANPDLIIAGQVLVLPGSGSSGGGVVHVVRPGETLSGIASRYGVLVRDLAGANGITNANLVIAGARLSIPASSGGGAAGGATTHLVRPGETLSGIASRYGVRVSELAGANGISNSNLVFAGQRLVIPGSAGSGGGGAGGGAGDRTGVPGTHTVQPGETLAGIAARYGISVQALAAANGIPQPYNIYATTRLQLDARNSQPGPLQQCPLPGARFANDWGFPRSGGRAHEGNDLFAPRGTPVLAPASGVVSFGTGTIGGNQFRLQGDDGMLYFGSHMDAFGTSGRVAAGAVIGYVGTTGNAAGGTPHLHFEIHPGGGAAMNPYPALRAAC
ncbi:MAG: LysM peptidoglycan-binding domain-containing protein [Acidimicrobiales bacterium]